MQTLTNEQRQQPATVPHSKEQEKQERKNSNAKTLRTYFFVFSRIPSTFISCIPSLLSSVCFRIVRNSACFKPSKPSICSYSFALLDLLSWLVKKKHIEDDIAHSIYETCKMIKVEKCRYKISWSLIKNMKRKKWNFWCFEKSPINKLPCFVKWFQIKNRRWYVYGRHCFLFGHANASFIDTSRHCTKIAKICMHWGNQLWIQCLV